MVLNLVDSGSDSRVLEQLLEVLDRVVADADGLDFVGVRLDELLEVLPGILVRYAAVNVSGAVFEFGEEGVVACQTSISGPSLILFFKV
jgi:hypothetical protein